MNVAVIDYESGNLRSVAKAFERASGDAGLGFSVNVTRDPDDLRAASHVVLPGVGAFGDCLRGLNAMDGMIAALEEAALTHGKPFLGICVGMQLLASVGHEHGEHTGLDWIPGDVVPLSPADSTLKIPHMGWNNLNFASSHPVADGLNDGDHAYFVHSYQFVCKNSSHILAKVDYAGQVTAMIARDNIIGTQFHPEKSQAVGLRLIENFLRWHP